MTHRQIHRILLFICLVAISCTTASAQSVKLEGVIKARNGSSMLLQTSSAPELVVLLTDNTQVGQVQGIFQVRKKEMAMTALIPGLAVKVEGDYDEQNQLVAKSVSFKGNDLERAQSIQAGMHETKMQSEKHKAELEKHNAAIEANAARFGELDDYYIFDEVKVYFGNAKTNIEPQYTSQLLALAKKAEGIDGYMIEVKGYASSVGNAKLNQQLSEDRAENVITLLIQQGRVPLTRILVPGAMGTSDQVADNGTAEGQAQNRRVVVRVLQNKAIAGPLSSAK